MGNKTEFVRVADILIDTLDFDQDINVSVFETNIRGNELVCKTTKTLHHFNQCSLKKFQHEN